MSLMYEFTDGVDAVEVGSYENATGTMRWTEVPIVGGIGVRVCGNTCADHCASRDSCGSCGGDEQCEWCSDGGGTCLPASAESTCTATTDKIGECLDECEGARTCATCAARRGCGWCHISGTCHGADDAGEQLSGHECPAASFATDAGMCAASASCPGAVNAVGMRAEPGFEPVAAFCGGRGTCDHDTGRCACHLGWGGAACDVRCPGAAGPCENRGSCDAASGRCHPNSDTRVRRATCETRPARAGAASRAPFDSRTARRCRRARVVWMMMG